MKALEVQSESSHSSRQTRGKQVSKAVALLVGQCSVKDWEQESLLQVMPASKMDERVHVKIRWS